jgi:metal-sulfur cluster biosynthetic enzyme
MISEGDVRRALDAVLDPCSAVAGAPAGLDSMGLLRRVEVREGPTGAHVEVRIGLTDPTCLMGAPFLASARDVLAGMDGVASFDVELDDGEIWTERDLSPAYRERLERVRARKREAAERRARPASRGEARHHAAG